MKVIDMTTSGISQIPRPKKNEGTKAASQIVDQVRGAGDRALLELTEKFDGVALTKLRVSKDDLALAEKMLTPILRTALQQSITNQQKFQTSLLVRKIDKVTIQKGITVWREWRAVDRVGLYVPGGLAAYPSTVIMNVVPAQVAGCREIAITTPVGKDGQVNQTVLATAVMLGITEIYKIGGAQAIAALAYGTETVQKVDKIYGPGNQYVTAAKQFVSQDVAIDMPAGPSEICIIADELANAAWVAADMLSQCEHDKQAQAVLITNSWQLIEQVQKQVEVQLTGLATRGVASASYEANAVFVVVQDTRQAVQVANIYAPEHLELQTKDNTGLLPYITNAGSVFVGSYSAEALGDYATGSNHVLPTSGFARAFSGLSVDSFGKWIEFQSVDKEGFQAISSTVATLAKAEGLVAHARAVTIRVT